MAHVGGLGFPVPRVHGAEGADLVMERDVHAATARLSYSCS